MSIDKKIIRWAFVFSLVMLFLSMLAYIFKDSYAYLEFASDLFLGLFTNGVMTVLVSMIHFQTNFKKSVNRILFYSKRAKIYYDKLYEIDKSRFFTNLSKNGRLL